MSEDPLENQPIDVADVPDDLIEIQDPQIDVEQIMEHIREKMAQRRRDLGYDQMNFPSFGGVVFPGRPDDLPYDANLYHHLQLANKLYTEVATEPVLVASPATRIPILGRIWELVRFQAHSLILFYVNRAVDQQVNLQRHLISAVNLLTVESQKQQRDIIRLEGLLIRLRNQLDDKE